MSDSELANPTMGDAEVTINEDASSPTAATPETEPADDAVAIQPAKQPAPVTLTKVVLGDMSTEELDKIVIESMLVNRERLIPALKEMRRLYFQPGCRKPIPGLPTWTEYVAQRIGRSMRTVQYWLEEPSAKIARGSKKKDAPPKPKPQLNPDPGEWTRWGKRDIDAKVYCQRLTQTLTTDEAKRDNPLLPFLSAIAETPGSASLPDMLRAFFRNLVRHFPTEEREGVAELIRDAAETEADLVLGYLTCPAPDETLELSCNDNQLADADGSVGQFAPAADGFPALASLESPCETPLAESPGGEKVPAKRRRLLLDFDDDSEDVLGDPPAKPVVSEFANASATVVAV
jgi:hypothetical protein